LIYELPILWVTQDKHFISQDGFLFAPGTSLKFEHVKEELICELLSADLII
jgi:hypothetical protein